MTTLCFFTLQNITTQLMHIHINSNWSHIQRASRRCNICCSGLKKAHVHNLWKGVQLQTPAERAHVEGARGRTAHKVVRSYLPSKTAFLSKEYFSSKNTHHICSHTGSRATGRVATTRRSTNRHCTPMSWRGTTEWKESTDKRWVWHMSFFMFDDFLSYLILS